MAAEKKVEFEGEQTEGLGKGSWRVKGWWEEKEGRVEEQRETENKWIL